MVVGVVIVFGVTLATFVTLFLVPMVYALIGRHTGSISDVSRRLETELNPSDDDLMAEKKTYPTLL
jgi:multidrug efflux pump